MKKKTVKRIVALVSTAALSAAALVMFAGCTTRHPQVTITYTFNGEDYEVDYTLSRNDAPKTVEHFIELADAGFYDGLCIHDYDSSFLRTGGYRLENGEPQEVDYFSWVKDYETENGFEFTQSVWMTNDTPLYTVYGEFNKNAVYPEYSNEYYHKAGALVMYYTEKGNFNGDVTVLRADGGKGNDGDPKDLKKYVYNSATSLFYTFTGETNSENDQKYSVFGMADDYEEQLKNGLLKAIQDYIDERTDDTSDDSYSFTTEKTAKINRYDPFEDVRKEGREETFNTPADVPVIVKSVKVTKY